MHTILQLSIGFSIGQRFAESDEFLHPHDFLAEGIHFECMINRFSDSQLFTCCSKVFPPKNAQTSVSFYCTTGDKVNQCIGNIDSLYFIGYHIKIVLCPNFDVRIGNAEIVLENRYDSSKICMVGISETLPNEMQILMFFLNFQIMIKSFSR